MKKLVKIISALTFVSFVTLTTTNNVEAVPQYPINLVIDNHNVEVKNEIEPFMMDRITYFPTDFLVSEFGANVVTTPNGVTITTKDTNNSNNEIIFTTGSLNYTINGVEYKAEVAPVVISSRLCIPTRSLAPFFNMNFEYSDATNTLTLKTNSYEKRLYQK